MNRGDIVIFKPDVAIWDTRSSPSSVIGRTDKKSIYVLLEDANDEVQVICPNGLVGWVSKRAIRN
jgi:hypothetical protein